MTDLAQALRAVQRRAARLRASKRARDEAIHAAVAAGASQVAVARAAGLSRARVQQILAEAS